MLSSSASSGLAIGGREGLAKRGRSWRWVWIAAGLVAVAVLAAAAYMLPGVLERGAEGIPLIKADTRPFKLQPEDPGGLEVPHQGMEIYNRIGNAGTGGAQPRVERLLPPPETPLPRPEPLPPVAEAPPAIAAPAIAAPAIAAPAIAAPAAQAPAAQAPAAQAPAEAAPPPVASSAPPSAPPAAAAPAPPAAAPAAPPAPAAVAPSPAKPATPPAATPPAATPPAATPPAAATPAAPPAAEASGRGGYRVQVGSVRSADSATAETARLRRTYGDLLGRLNMNVVRAEMASGVAVYRLQAGPMGDAQAHDLCDKLKARKLGCLVIKP